MSKAYKESSRDSNDSTVNKNQLEKIAFLRLVAEEAEENAQKIEQELYNNTDHQPPQHNAVDKRTVDSISEAAETILPNLNELDPEKSTPENVLRTTIMNYNQNRDEFEERFFEELAQRLGADKEIVERELEKPV